MPLRVRIAQRSRKKTIENYKDPENDSSDGTVYGSYVSYSESSGAKISDK